MHLRHFFDIVFEEQTLTPRISYHNMVNHVKKYQVLEHASPDYFHELSWMILPFEDAASREFFGDHIVVACCMQQG